jgi:predicted membrane channel-forming protein YqfA (hemolysin III family)
MKQLDAPYDELHFDSSKIIMVMAAMSIIFCLLSSSLYHLYYPMGRKTYDRLLRVDLIGIGIMIFGLTLCGSHAAFHNF